MEKYSVKTMIYTYESKIGKLEAPFELKLGREALITYEYFNSTNHNLKCALPGVFKNTINLLDRLNKQKSEHYFYNFSYEIEKNNFHRNLLMAFSGSLNSIFQTYSLKKLNYNITLFYLNYNTSLDIKKINEIKNLSQKLNLPLIVCNLKLNNTFLVQNSFNKLLLYSLMLDCCQFNNIHYISSGDNLLNAYNVKTLSKLKCVMETFFNELYLQFNFDFIPALNINKSKKLLKLIDLHLDSAFTDCINTDKFLKINKNKLVTYFDINLPINNCGMCYKCVFYNLLRHYYLNQTFPDKYINYCWEHIITETNSNLFSYSLPLEIRIKNLLKN